MNYLFNKKAGVLFLTFILTLGMSGCGGKEESNKAPVVSVQMPYTIAAVGDTVTVPEASVTDEDTLTATAAVYRGEEKVADVTDNRFTVSAAGEYTLRYTAKDSGGLEGSAETKVRFVESVTGTKLEAAIPAGESAEILLGASAINAATGKTDGTFDATDYDYIYSDIENTSADSLLVGTKLTAKNKTVDLTTLEKSSYEKMAIGASATKTVRFTSDYLVHRGGNGFEGVSSVVYFVKNEGETEKNISLTVKNFVLGKASVLSSAHFKAVESKEGVEDKFLDLSDLKLLYDLSGETALDYIGEEKVTGKGEMSTQLTEDNKLRLTVKNESTPATCQWRFFSWNSDVGVSQQGLLKRDLSGVEYIVMIFERDEGVVYGDATICLYLQSDEWGTSWNLACPYHGLNNMWFGNIQNQDGVNKNLVYYYLPIAESIEEEYISAGWCSEVDTLMLQIAGLPADEERSLTLHGIYWC